MYMTDDVKTIMRCTDSKDAESCMPEFFMAKTDPSVKVTPVCQWRKGAVVAKNDKLDTANKALFESNICHPLTTDNWDEEAPSCLKNVDNLSCEKARCMWSTMQEFIPFAEVSPAKPTCLPAETTMVAQDFSRCSKLSETECSGTCKMYDLAKYQKPSTLPPVDPTKPPVT
jgi:hypothetical protein